MYTKELYSDECFQTRLCNKSTETKLETRTVIRTGSRTAEAGERAEIDGCLEDRGTSARSLD